MQDMSMMRGRCIRCEHEFDIVALPMPIELAANAIKGRSQCPMCGNHQGNVAAASRQLDTKESWAKGKTIAMGSAARAAE